MLAKRNNNKNTYAQNVDHAISIVDLAFCTTYDESFLIVVAGSACF